MQEIKLHYDDVTIVPEEISDIESRKECNPYIEGMLPIFAAPMSTVIDENNWETFYDNKINVVIPRSVDFETRLDIMAHHSNKNNERHPFVAFSLKEVDKVFVKKDGNGKSLTRILNNINRSFNVCIDMANGHMTSLLNEIKTLKGLYGERIVIMAGNIANPATYKQYNDVCCDYVRVCIGSGSACTTASNVGVYYPSFSLLKEMYDMKVMNNFSCKIVADGGIKGYRDIQKALIYADYVMIGGIFNKTIESAGKTTYGSFYYNVRGNKIYRPLKTLFRYGKEIPKEKFDESVKLIKEGKLTVWKEFYGMSTKRAQTVINNGTEEKKECTLKTSEGLVKHNKVEFDIKGWVENETDYLRSAMSYTNSKNLDEYKNSKWVQINKISYNN